MYIFGRCHHKLNERKSGKIIFIPKIYIKKELETLFRSCAKKKKKWNDMRNGEGRDSERENEDITNKMKWEYEKEAKNNDMKNLIICRN